MINEGHLSAIALVNVPEKEHCTPDKPPHVRIVIWISPSDALFGGDQLYFKSIPVIFPKRGTAILSTSPQAKYTQVVPPRLLFLECLRAVSNSRPPIETIYWHWAPPNLVIFLYIETNCLKCLCYQMFKVHRACSIENQV